ncbi:MAG TPA: prepilin-type N-terminal cleavage/methylation domain-containing protein [Candidatus Aquabacterium excrementipullorum]|nr:prepilin-type N-terminal cleavage/methylation domain-containing protein [Candidatus Aquabacterium excrementipullorum]
MPGNSSDACHVAAPRFRGFTLPELLIVMILAGIVAAFVIPKLDAIMGVRTDAWRDQLTAALRYAQKTAVSHRRLVCMDVAGTSITLNIATTRAATSCNTGLAGPVGSSEFGTSDSSSVSVSVSPAGTLYFQADGRVTTDGAGATTTTRVFTISGTNALTLYGETGYAE